MSFAGLRPQLLGKSAIKLICSLSLADDALQVQYCKN
jgi:hypothetical protein